MHNHHHQRRVAHLIGIGITSLCAVVLLASGVIGVPTPASAASSCGGVDTSIISGDACDGASLTSTDSADNPVVSVLIFVMKILTGAVGVAAVGTLIYAGILYSAAGGESGQVQKAKTIIKDTVIGIVCYAGMIIILNFVIPGGVFGQQSVTGGGTAASPGGNGTSPDIPTTIAGACYWKQFANAPNGDLYHRSGSVPYAFEDSPDGITYASKHGYERIDLDLRLTKDGVVVVTHSQNPLNKDPVWGGFSDTAGKITNRKVDIKDLTFAEVSRLKHKDGYRIYSLQYLIGVASKTKLSSLYLELKTPDSLKSHLPEIAAMLNQVKMPAVIAGQTDHTGQLSALAYARELGFWTRNITAHTWGKPSKNSALCSRLGG
jgi:hypothetical protein